MSAINGQMRAVNTGCLQVAARLAGESALLLLVFLPSVGVLAFRACGECGK
jgi:ABC-type phosphate transport system permease subunit